MNFTLEIRKIGRLLLITVLFYLGSIYAGEMDFSFHEASYINLNYKNKFSVLDPLNQIIHTGHESFDHYLNMKSENYLFNKLTFKLNMQVYYTKEEADFHHWDLKELFAGFDAGNLGTFTVGRIIVDWGRCYYKKPAAVLDPQIQAEDFNNVRNAYRGVDLIRWELYFGSISLDAVAINSLDHFRNDRWNFVSRIGSYWKMFEYNFIFAYFQRQKTRLGVSFTSVWGKHLEWHGEYLYSARMRNYSFDNPSRRWNVKSGNAFSTGFMLTPGWFHRDVRIIAEYAYDNQGFSQTEWSNYKNYLTAQYYSMLDYQNPDASVASSNYQQTVVYFQTDRIIRHVIFGTIDNLPPVFHIEVQPVILFSPQDNGVIGILDFSSHFLNAFSLYCNINFYGGKKGSVYQSIPYKNSVLLGLSLHHDLRF